MLSTYKELFLVVLANRDFSPFFRKQNGVRGPKKKTLAQACLLPKNICGWQEKQDALEAENKNLKESVRVLKAGSTQQVQATLLAEREEMQEEIFRLKKTLRIALNAEQQAVNIPKSCHFLLKPVSRTRITKGQF
jgi:hypothetical protein